VGLVEITDSTAILEVVGVVTAEVGDHQARLVEFMRVVEEVEQSA
jgi:hypothetical protein